MVTRALECVPLSMRKPGSAILLSLRLVRRRRKVSYRYKKFPPVLLEGPPLFPDLVSTSLLTNFPFRRIPHRPDRPQSSHPLERDRGYEAFQQGNHPPPHCQPSRHPCVLRPAVLWSTSYTGHRQWYVPRLRASTWRSGGEGKRRCQQYRCFRDWRAR